MSSGRAVPIVVGVGDIKNRSQEVDEAIEPVRLMIQAIRAAIKDADLSPSKAKELQSSIDSVGVVNTWTWPYSDLPGLISEQLGIHPTHTVLSHHGGDSPAKLFDEAARRISFRESKVAIITGGEALASLSACAAAGISPPGWTTPDKSGPSVSVSDVSSMKSSIGTHHSVGLPIHVYPLYENGFRAYRGQSIQDNNRESAELYADFARVAEANPLAWNHGQSAAIADLIGKPKPITLLGGLTSFGGAGNNYSMHALTEMVRVLRRGESKTGLVLANGGMLTYQYVVCLSSQPRTSPYPDRHPLPDLVRDEPVPSIEESAEGEAVIETYTVEFARDGSPRQGHIVGRLQSNGHRFLANHGNESTLQQLASASKDPIGESGWVWPGEGRRNIFTFTREAKL
ncbi:hypothetical protein QTJ16_002321 [Diplocarpon rosae]|uniref:Thiolase-like protein type 1 additional C-terminal domain-containing protein n=1 Tax=Diplocarpon rosae TaxID=946125 RepID=A0AAD9WDU2_9HELO|nr:hypothetical protein QTJ16_002321 [Diplocarpon rosae]